MESCHSVLPPITTRKVPHPPPYRRLPPKIYSTLGHLIEIIEQLKSSDNLGTVLRNLVAEVDDKSPANSQGSYVDLDPGTIIKIAQILRKLNANSATMTTENHGTSKASSAGLEVVSGETPGRTQAGGERAHRATSDGRNLTLSKQDSLYLVKKIRDFEQKCKPLQEKNKKFLEKNMELTAQNRDLKEQIRNITEENRKLKENLDQARRKCSLLSRQLGQEKMEKGSLEIQLEEIGKLRAEIAEQSKTIANMRQASAEKDRRMEVLQHRKKRRLRMSVEHLSRLSSPCSVADDERSQDSDLSYSSMSVGTLSDDDILEELPNDDTEKLEKNYKKVMKEHLALQKSAAQLQNALGWRTDSQRYVKSKLDFETDLYIAQCKIENLEECLAKYKEYDSSWVLEKDQLVLEHDQLSSEKNHLISENEKQSGQIEKLKENVRETTNAYEELKEQTEHLEFLVLETQESKTEPTCTADASTSTEDELVLGFQHFEEQANELVSLCCREATLKVKLEMSEAMQQEYRATIKGLEEKLSQLLHGQGSEVAIVMQQLKQAEKHVIDVIEVEKTMHDLESQVTSLQQELSGLSEKLSKCQQENSGLVQKLAQYRGKLDSQEQSLALTRDEREELLQVKPKPQGSVLNNRLRLAEMGQEPVRQRLLEREGSQERICSPMESPRSPGSVSNNRLSLSFAGKTTRQSEITETVATENGKEAEIHFEQLEANMEYIEPVNYDNLETKRPRLNSMPVIGTDRSGIFSEVDKLQRQIQDLQEENDVLKFELMQKGHGDSDASGSDSEDSRLAELRETCENLRERLQSAEATERQCKDRLKFAEKHINELELAETVLRDRVEEGNTDCDKLRKQIVRLQRKIRELKDINLDRDTNEQALLEKVKYFEDAEAQLSQKVTELEGTNHILKQRLDVRDELTADVQLVETLTLQVKTLQAENNELESKMIDLEENNELLRDNWRKVADEEANRRDCLEEKIRVLESANNDLKTKLNEKESDMDMSSGPSIATEINDDTIEQLNKRIEELENELQNVRLEKDERIGSLENILQQVKKHESELSETVSKIETSEKDLQDKMEKNEQDFKEEISEMEKAHEKKINLLQHEIAEYQQQEDDLCTRIEELEENETKLNDKISKYIETEMNYKNKIEELENRETSLTIGFSQRVEELARNEKEVSEKFQSKIEELEDDIEKLTSDNSDLIKRINTLEKHEKELSEKAERASRESSPPEQENVELLHFESDNGITSLEIHDKYKSSIKLESEASVSAPISNQTSETKQLQSDNQNLLDEISKLKAVIQVTEKEHKVLEDKLKRQEKKRKRSERADNVDDYDTIAREVVTYKLEVEQLRTENTDLHERVIELDESEKNLLERNEQLVNDIEEMKNSQRSTENGNDELNTLQKKIIELEEIEKNLRDKLEESQNNENLDVSFTPSALVKQQSSDSAYESSRDVLKETAEKSVGTDDFMEGVMAGQEQGKPVSSMFERIQILEAENQELSTKLSTLTATDAQIRQLSEKVKALEENEDSLMERVMELEDEEDRLTRELNKFRKSTSSVTELEEELSNLQDCEQELNSTIESLKNENSALKKTMESSYSEKGDIAIRLAAVQKQYDGEKKKVESLLKGEERLMKSMSSEKRAVKEIEDELANTQEKLEELQTEYENKLSEKDESEKVLKEELNKLYRDKEIWKKKLQEYEKSNSELEDEIEACKISESRMFHRHQQLITQNEELELKLSKLVKLIPDAGEVAADEIDKKSEKNLMAENPEVISENPLTTSIFTESELDLLRSKTPDTELLGSVPLDMLRKIQDFDKREQNYQSKVKEIESKNLKLVKKIKVLQGKEKDLKHENKELQLELLKLKEPNSSLRASTSSLDLNKSESDDGLDIDSPDGVDDQEIFHTDTEKDSLFEEMTHEELLLTVKLQEEKQNRVSNKMAEFEDWLKGLLEQLGALVTSESLHVFVQNVESLKAAIKSQSQSEIIKQSVTEVLEKVTSLRQRLEVLQDSEEKLRISLAENELKTEKFHSQSSEKIDQLEAQIQVMAKLSHKYQSVPSENSVEVGTQSCLEEHPLWEHLESSQNNFTAPLRQFCLETSKTINIDVPPTESIQPLQRLGHSETVNVNVPPSPQVHVEVDPYLGNYPVYGNADTPIMMDKAEDVLRQRIRELEKLEKHLKQQVSDLEADREELHGIARTDKNVIHEQNIRIRELQLSQRNLQEQIKKFETSENSLYARLDELEGEMDNKDDRIRDLEILEQRLKDLVKQYKLDEKILQTKSQTLESSVKEMNEKEETLKQKVQNLESEKSAFSERSEYLQMRLKEIECAETDLAQRAKNQDNIMQTLQNTVIELETFGANAHARVIELEQINFDLQQRLHHAMTENSPLSKRTSTLQQQCDSMENEVSTLRDLEVQLRQENEALQKSENSLQQEVKNLRMKEVEFDGKMRVLEEADSVMKDKLSKLQRSENTLKYRVQELETSGIQAPSDLNSSQTSNIKLPRTLEECQRRIIVLQSNNAELQSRLQQQDISGTSPQEVSQGSRGMVSLPQAEYQTLQRKSKILEQTENQLEQSDHLNTHLQETVAQLREGKDVCGHEAEIEVLRSRLDQANKSVKMLQRPSAGQWIGQGPDGVLPGSGRSPRREEVLNDLASHLEGGEIKETMTRTTSKGAQSARPPGQKLSRDNMIEDLLQTLQAPSPTGIEDDHWREIETRMEASGRGGEQWISVGKATSLYATDPTGSNINRSHGKNEELELGVALQSETESQIYSQNDTDSGRYGNRVSPRIQQQRHLNSQAPPLPQIGPPRGGSVKVTDGFGDSLYVHSSTHDSAEDILDQNKEIFLRQLGQQAAPSVAGSMVDSGRGTASVSMATSGMTLRERIAYIERQLSARESDSARELNGDMDFTSWKARAHDTNRRLEIAEKENKHFKDEINKLEKELEEKTRLYLSLEAFLKSVRIILADKDGVNEKELISKLGDEVEKVTSNMEDGGHRPEDISHDPAALNTELAKKDRELNAKRNEVDSLMRELRQWQQECRCIEDMRSNALDSLRSLEVEISELQVADKQLKDLKDDYNTLKGQGDDDGKKSATTAPLRARILQLTNLCNEKDILIKKLVQELKRLKSGARSSPLVDELTRLENKSDHNHNILGRSSSQSSLDSLDRMSVASDTELIREHSAHHAPRPRSADIHNQQRNTIHRHSYHGSTNLPRVNRNHRNALPLHRAFPLNDGRVTVGMHSPHPPTQGHGSSRGDEMYRTQQYVAIADYDPALFSQSGHPRMELSLQEGDLVLVTGPLHENGYLEGEVRGRVGLVPISYLQPSPPHRTAGGQHPIPEHLNATPERIAQLYSSLQGVHQSDTHGFPNGFPSTQLHGNQRNKAVSMAKGPPAPPDNFHAEKIIGNSSLMLAWQPILLDSFGCSNGVKVTGYKVYKNNKVIVQPRGRQASKAIIENINIQTHHRFGIQTVGADGQVSELTEFMYEGFEEVTSDENSDTESEMDMATVLNVDEYKTGTKRMFMGIYDYDPTKNSPYDHPSCELAFNAGDIITVYGRQRGDGFYYGEINGVRGLVPTFFIEEMPQPPPRTKKMSRIKQTNKESKTETR